MIHRRRASASRRGERNRPVLRCPEAFSRASDTEVLLMAARQAVGGGETGFRPSRRHP